ncbi:MAG: hypothetical protein IPM14_02190 [bacterium]|nr:hypothetical protein [bacterium]
MGRKIIGVIVGYVAMATFVFISFTILYMILGPEGSFQPGTYQVSAIWLVLSLVLGLFAAIIGGLVCVLIAKDKSAALWLAGLVLVLGLVLAIPQFGISEEEMNKIREGNVDNMEAMQNAKQPPLTLILNPIIGAVGVIAGSRLKKVKQA